ncbi:MAG: LysM peptidoglycan-binding domain-containing protein [Verrucomicrobia bacterium]|nr:LysM peptidoglycan-binding domain-containing protein [Verrucomicrobiota bacterium]MBU4289721.1 LysM peptidoglycan-binding domain-containing protein [Verrucomicrobiota bacterium]MBU4429190.1 LysM peptidoglycan-binding domain-containing protein [Verrucomicrobiota bacterium]MCG2679845.1 LysM peptidoglycan-binding domain-containing protein [Kiritimatiellia bacterium]
MKTMGLILIVVALHCAVIGSVFFISGCGITSKTEAPPALPTMPSPKPPRTQPEAVPVDAEKNKVSEPVPAKEIKSAGGGEYIVQPGDTLGVIAKRCHVTMVELIEANKLADPNKLKVGQKLILPAQGQLPPATAPHTRPVKAKAKAKAAGTETIQAGAYVVKSGDNLSKIAAHSGVKVSELREANKLQSDKLKIGQKLTIPEAKKAEATESVVSVAGAESGDVVIPAPATTPVPPVQGTEVAPAISISPNAAPISSSGIIHVAQPNEDLSSIAKLYAVTVEEIVELNQLSTNRNVQVGQRLKIP